MHRLQPTRACLRFAVLLALTPALPGHAQVTPAQAARPQSFPATQPTQAVPPPPAPRPPAPRPVQAHHTQVLYNGDLLSIHAENSSLNGILREISRQTGMVVTGGVSDERVYGNYGPADTGSVLADLLSGTGSNMLLKESTDDRPKELVLTPRQGGASPPSPAAVAPDEDERESQDTPPQQVRPQPLPGYQPQAPTSSPNDPGPPPSAQIVTPDPQPTTATPAVTTPATTATDSTQQQSPNGVKTPQQIYDELMKLKQQQKTPAPN